MPPLEHYLQRSDEEEDKVECDLEEDANHKAVKMTIKGYTCPQYITFEINLHRLIQLSIMPINSKFYMLLANAFEHNYGISNVMFNRYDQIIWY